MRKVGVVTFITEYSTVTTIAILGLKYKKPRRPCPFCAAMVTRLRRHLLSQHRTEKDVRMLEGADEVEGREISDRLRKRGILLHNQKQAERKDPEYIGERRHVAKKVLCTTCNGFYSKDLFYRHSQKCMGDATNLDYLAQTNSGPSCSFFAQVASKIQTDEVGLVAKTDSIILLIGERMYSAARKKVHENMEIRHRTMSSMRLLARILLEFRSHKGLEDADGSAIFNRIHFPILETVVTNMAKTDDEGFRHGLKQKILYLLKSSATILKATFRSQMKDTQADEMSFFLEVLSLNQDSLFGDATFAVMKNRHEKLRMPETLPSEDDVSLLRNHILSEIRNLTGKLRFTPPNITTYVRLRDALCSRLTLFNGRRGNEVSRLRCKHVDDAVSKRWIKSTQNENFTQEDQIILKDYLITYMPGKGNHMVPVIVPPDCVEGLKIVCDEVVRRDIGVSEKNQFVFPNTGNSNDHVTGWPCIRKLCQDAGVSKPELLTATRQRHRISTLFAAKDATTKEREILFRQLGHTPDTNEGSYQHPLAAKELTVMGRHLTQFDKGRIAY